MGQFLTSDFIGTRTRFQRFSDCKLFHGWIQNLTVNSMAVRSTTDCLMQLGDRFMFSLACSHANARLVVDFHLVDALELGRSTSFQLNDSTMASVVEVPEATFVFKVASQLELQPPSEEGRLRLDGWVVAVQDSSGQVENSFLSDVSETGAGILSPTPLQRGEQVLLKVEAAGRNLDVEAEVRYSVRSKLVPDMFKAGLKLSEFGRLEGALWRNILKAA